MASQVSINGRTFITNARSINVSQNGDRIFVNGVEVGDDYIISGTNGPEINIVVEGSVEDVTTNVGDVVVKGDAGQAKTTSGDVLVEGDVKGNVSAVSGDVKIRGSLYGNASTVSGDVRHKQ